MRSRSSFFWSLLLLLFLHQTLALAVSQVEKTCRQLALRRPYFDYQYCVNVLLKDPKSATAGTLEQAEIATKLTSIKATQLNSHISQIIKKGVNPSERQILARCFVRFTEMGLILGDSINLIIQNKPNAARVQLKRARKKSNDCVHAFQEGKMASPVAPENEDLTKTLDLSSLILGLVVG